MREFWILFKVNIVNTFGINRLKKKFAQNSFFLRIIMPIITILLAIGFIALFIVYLKPISDIFYITDNMIGFLKFGIGMGILMCFITTISKANSYLFESKDFDLLMSLPIKPRVVIASKFASLLFINWASFALFFIPTAFWYVDKVRPDIVFFIMALLVILIGPLLIITICSILSYLLGLLLSKFKHRNIIQSLGLVIIFVGIMFISFSYNGATNMDPQTDLDAYKTIADNFEKYATTLYYPSVWMAETLEGNIVSLLIFLAISFVPYMIFAYVVGQNFVQANARARVSYTDKNFKLKEQNVAGQTMTLFKKEVKRYFSSSILVLNTIVGPIMGTIVVIVLLLGDEGFLGAPGLLVNDVIVPILIVATTFMNGMIATTATSISLEGKNFWIIKSAPIAPEKVFIAKIAMNFILALPFTIINTIIITIALKPNALLIIPILFIPLLVNIFVGVFGLYINLVFPRLDWTAEVKVVKQSLSTFLSMLFGMISVVGLAFLFYKVYSLKFFAYVIIMLVLVLLIALGIVLLRTDGKKRYNNINA